MKMLQNTICSIITFRVYIVWWKGEKYPGHWSKELNPATIPGSSQVHMILTYLSWWKLIWKKKKKRQNKKKNNPEVSEICFPIPINKSVQSIKQKKAGEFMGIFTYGSRSPLKKKKKKICDNNYKKWTTKPEAEYEIVTYCFRACTILHKQET